MPNYLIGQKSHKAENLLGRKINVNENDLQKISLQSLNFIFFLQDQLSFCKQYLKGSAGILIPKY